MTGCRLAIACLAALLCAAPVGCSEPESDQDAGVADDAGQIGSDAGYPHDAGSPCDGSCPSGSHCDGAQATCVCDRACGESEYCDLLQLPARCVEICNGGLGCLAGWEECRLTGADEQGRPRGECIPLSCGGKRCDFGQGCFDPSSMAPSETSACTCLPELESSNGAIVADSCEIYGKVCGLDPRHPAASTCRLPEEYEPCLRTIGCAGGLECLEYDGEAFCVKRCETSADCPSVDDACLSADPANGPLANHCYLNVCATPWKTPSDRERYFQPCPTGIEGQDGTCIPLSHTEGGATVDIGICRQAGTAPSLGPCVAAADRSDLTALCPINEACEPVQPDETGTKQVGLCRRLCNGAPNPTPATGCDTESAGGDLCIDVSGIEAASPGSQHQARLGFCRTQCDLTGSAPCPDDALGNAQGCQRGSETDPQGYCRSLRPGAAGPDQPCEPEAEGSLERRSACADRLACLPIDEAGSAWRCFGICSLDQCPNAEDTCQACAGLACQPCAPSCPEGGCGGDDGCGGTCGCPEGSVCRGGACCERTCGAGSCGGDDGCGGTCGCASGEICSGSACVPCSPDCSAGCGGSDGCGGICGCPPGERCEQGACAACVPDCRLKSCGDDGCGGECGVCDPGERCLPAAIEDRCSPLGFGTMSEMLGLCSAPPAP